MQCKQRFVETEKTVQYLLVDNQLFTMICPGLVVSGETLWFKRKRQSVCLCVCVLPVADPLARC